MPPAQGADCPFNWHFVGFLDIIPKHFQIFKGRRIYSGLLKGLVKNEKNVSAEQRQKKKETRLYGKNVNLGRKKSFERAQKKRPQNHKRLN